VSVYLQQGREKLQAATGLVHRFLLLVKRLLQEQLNRNIYTRILFTNVTVFVAVMIALTMFTSFLVTQVTYDQAQQQLLRRARRVNFALLQQTDFTFGSLPDDTASDGVQGRQDLLKFLADTFDSRITIFDREGNILGASAEQEVVPGSKVEAKFLEILSKGEPTITRKVDRETNQITFIAFVPMGSSMDPIENGILLEAKPANLDLALNRVRFYLLGGGMVILVIIIFISVYLAMCISRPISGLSATVAEISRGSYVLNAEDQSLDEINILTGQLNKLTVRLQKMQAASSKMEEERDRLFAEISHELRTPLTAVQGFVEAIRDGMAQDEALLKRYLDTIYTQTVHITRLVDDMLSLSRLESGNITVEKLPVNLTALTQGVVMSMEGMASSKNTTLIFDKKQKMPP
jgi:signal transduction histidine kinase